MPGQLARRGPPEPSSLIRSAKDYVNSDAKMAIEAKIEANSDFLAMDYRRSDGSSGGFVSPSLIDLSGDLSDAVTPQSLNTPARGVKRPRTVTPSPAPDSTGVAAQIRTLELWRAQGIINQDTFQTQFTFLLSSQSHH